MAGATRTVDGTSPSYRLDPSTSARPFPGTAVQSSPENRSHADCFDIPSARPISAHMQPCPRASWTVWRISLSTAPEAAHATRRSSSGFFPHVPTNRRRPFVACASSRIAFRTHAHAFHPRQVSLTTGYIRPTPHVLPRRKGKTRAQGDLSAGGSATSSRRRSAGWYSMTSGCGTTSAGRCSAAEGTSGRQASGLGRGVSSARGPYFQPGTRPACSIHLCISGPCASSMVVSLT